MIVSSRLIVPLYEKLDKVQYLQAKDCKPKVDFFVFFLLLFLCELG